MPSASVKAFKGFRKNPGKGRLKKIRVLGSLVLIFLGAAIVFESLSLGLGNWSVPGPGFLPFGAGLGLLLSSLLTFFHEIIKKGVRIDEKENFWPRPNSKRNVSLVLLSLVGHTFLWNGLGFSLSTFLLMFFLFRIVGQKKWLLSIAGAMLASFLAYIFFGIFLESQLPSGFLGF